ncbi:carboxypeptidase regulatory-like domain-containing protein [candidate division TA06 bacterium]|nr:carboxypeptidase regulatory-like domain-containing protein [candidate division TA06 bacterium]
MRNFLILIMLAAAASSLSPAAVIRQDNYGPGVEHDLAVVSIDTPADLLVPPGMPFYPAFTLENFGIYYEDSVWAYFAIEDSLAQRVYFDSLMMTDSLAPGSGKQLVLGTSFAPESLMKYTATACLVLAGDEVPFNDTLQQEFTTFEYTGRIEGFVTDDNAGGIPLDGAVITAASAGVFLSDTSVSGNYAFPSAPVGSYTITAGKAGYFDSVVTAVSLTVGATIAVNFSLGYPAVVLNPAESVSVLLSPNSIDSTQYLHLEIGGTRDLQYTVEWPEQTAKSKSFSDSLWGLEVSGLTGDNLCLGVEYDGTNLWVSGAASDPASDPNYLYKLDKSGSLLASYPQPSGNGWGWRDLCFDGSYLYAASGDSIEQIDTASGAPTGLKIYAHTSPCRGLAYDPAADCFYTANYSDDIRLVNRDGSLANSWPNSKNIFGLALDATAPDGPWLWVFSQDGFPQVQASQLDPSSGSYTGVSFQCQAADPANACAGGATFSTGLVPGRGILLGLLQDATDRLVGYDIRPHNAPWLTLSKTSGSFTPPDSDSIRLIFNNAGLDSSLTYRALVKVFDQTGTVRDSVTAILNSPTGVEGNDISGDILTGRMSLSTAPNPFSQRTMINIQLTKPGPASLSVYNISGQQVRSIMPVSRMTSGIHPFLWNGTGDGGRRLPNGVYFLRLQTKDERLVHKVLLLR